MNAVNVTCEYNNTTCLCQFECMVWVLNMCSSMHKWTISVWVCVFTAAGALLGWPGWVSLCHTCSRAEPAATSPALLISLFFYSVTFLPSASTGICPSVHRSFSILSKTVIPAWVVYNYTGHWYTLVVCNCPQGLHCSLLLNCSSLTQNWTHFIHCYPH